MIHIPIPSKTGTGGRGLTFAGPQAPAGGRPSPAGPPSGERAVVPSGPHLTLEKRGHAQQWGARLYKDGLCRRVTKGHLCAILIQSWRKNYPK